MTETHDEGRYSINARLLLTHEQRLRLFALCQQRQLDLSDVLSEIVSAFLDSRDDLHVVERDTTAEDEQRRELQRRQIRQLRIQASRLGEHAPAWLRSYLADLEREARGDAENPA